jgi:thioredoxin reductase (NADPH)
MADTNLPTRSKAATTVAQGADMHSRPTLFVVDDDETNRRLVVGMLRRRYGADYSVVGAGTIDAARDRLAQLRNAGAQVALIAASMETDVTAAIDFLASTRERFATARRIALTPWVDQHVLQPVARASTLGQIDHVATVPWGEADEQFLATIGDVLADWAAEHGRVRPPIRMVGRKDPESQLISDVLQRWGAPLEIIEPDFESDSDLRPEIAPDQLPMVVLPDGRALPHATIAKLSNAIGADTGTLATKYDVVVLGLGPAGLSATVNAAAEGLRVLMVEPSYSQASSSPMIRNYLGFPAGVSGAELVRRAWTQATMFGAYARVGRAANGVRVEGHELVVGLDDETEARTAAVVLATGVAYRRIGIPSIERLVGRGVFYSYGASEAQALAGEVVTIVGGGNSAAQAAVHAARYARSVRLLVRGQALDGVSDYLQKQLGMIGSIDVVLNSELVGAQEPEQLASVFVRNRLDESVTEYETAGLFILIGAVPRTDWLPPAVVRDEKGYILTGNDAVAAAALDGRRLPLETTMNGVFAAGDVRAGSVKRVAAAVGEGASAIQQLLRYRSVSVA